MKSITFFGLPVFLFFCLIITIPFQGCEPDDDCDDETPCDTCNIVRKPNMYIYPETNIQLSVTLDFPLGGEILTSLPEYGDGWSITVDTNGLIDNTYTYLFYESSQPDVWQYQQGWIIKINDLSSFFKNNMTDYGFNAREIEDFMEYWIPRLNDYPYYSICPQTKNLIDNVVAIDFSIEPDNSLRLFYVIKGCHQIPDKLSEPGIETFKRVGYFVTEWGVIIK